MAEYESTASDSSVESEKDTDSDSDDSPRLRTVCFWKYCSRDDEATTSSGDEKVPPRRGGSRFLVGKHCYVSYAQSLRYGAKHMIVCSVFLLLAGKAARARSQWTSAVLRCIATSMVLVSASDHLDLLAGLAIRGHISRKQKFPILWAAALSGLIELVPLGVDSEGRYMFAGFIVAFAVFMLVLSPVAMYMHFRGTGCAILRMLLPFAIVTCVVFQIFVSLAIFWIKYVVETSGNVHGAALSVIVHALEFWMVVTLAECYKKIMLPLLKVSDARQQLGHLRLYFDFTVGCTYLASNTCWLATLYRSGLEDPSDWTSPMQSIVVHLLLAVLDRTEWLNRLYFFTATWMTNLFSCLWACGRKMSACPDNAADENQVMSAEEQWQSLNCLQRFTLPSLATRLFLGFKYSLGWMKFQSGLAMFIGRCLLLGDPVKAAFCEGSSCLVPALFCAALVSKLVEDMAVTALLHYGLKPSWVHVLNAQTVDPDEVQANQSWKLAWKLEYHQALARAPAALSASLSASGVAFHIIMAALFFGGPKTLGCAGNPLDRFDPLTFWVRWPTDQHCP